MITNKNVFRLISTLRLKRHLPYMLFAGGLLTIFLSSCSSSPNEMKKEAANSVDASLRGLAGVIEKNPPVQQGDYIAKYPNGIVKIRGYYIHGKRNGQWISFFENGKMQSEGFFKDGLRDGKATVYYTNGKVYYEGYYKDGKEAGKWVFYDDAGNKINEKDYNAVPSRKDTPDS